MSIFKIGTGTKLSIVKDPFKKNSIKSIFFNYQQWSGKWKCSGTVEFKNGNTTGEQRFETDDFDSCVVQVKEFINSLD